MTFMDGRELSQTDRETLKLELKNSIDGRQRNIKGGIFTFVGGLALGATFYYLELGRLDTAITLISAVTVIVGLFNLTSWFLFSKSIAKLTRDIEKGIKNVGQFEILSYNPLTRKVTLDKGFKIHSFEITYDWKMGDQIYIERLPTSNFILSVTKTLHD